MDFDIVIPLGPNELKNIQKGLDGIINDTNDININLKQKNLI